MKYILFSERRRF